MEYSYNRSESLKNRLLEAVAASPQLGLLLNDDMVMSGLSTISNHRNDICRKTLDLCRPYMNIETEMENEE